MIVAGIDPGTIRCGIAVVEIKGSRLSPVLLEAYQLRKRDPIEDRLHQLYRRLSGVFLQHRPVTMALEKAFVWKDPRAAIVIGEARAAAIIAARGSNTKVIQMNASEARKAACGRGDIKKPDAARFVKMLLGLSYMPSPDEGDAGVLACAAALRQPRSPDDDVPDDSRVDREIRRSVK